MINGFKICLKIQHVTTVGRHVSAVTYYCCIRSERLLNDAERDLLAVAKFLVIICLTYERVLYSTKLSALRFTDFSAASCFSPSLQFVVLIYFWLFFSCGTCGILFKLRASNVCTKQLRCRIV